MTDKKYNIIYADPPWSYGRWNLCKQFKGEKIHYPTMTIEEIKALPIHEITEKDSILFLWAIYPCLQEAFEVIKAWGFSYKTVAFTWVKRNKNSPTHFIGMGNWTRANAEICLLATKGNPKRMSKSVRQIIDTPLKHHSQKPTEARERIVELLGDLPRIELFAREKPQGWDVYGNEVQSDITL